MGDAITYAEMNFKRQSCAPPGIQNTENDIVTYAALKNVSKKKPKSSKSCQASAQVDHKDEVYAAISKPKQAAKKDKTMQDGYDEGDLSWNATTKTPGKQRNVTWREKIQTVAGGKWSVMLLPIFATLCLILLISLIYLSATCDKVPKSAAGQGANYYYPGGTSSGCPNLWIGINNKCYFFSEDKKKQTDSKQYCANHNSTLATTKEETILRLVRLTNQEFWIGLTHLVTQNGKWTGKWADGSKENFPEEAGSCAKLGNRLALENCYSDLHWICERDAA